MQLFFFIFPPSLLQSGKKEDDTCIHHLTSLQHRHTGVWEAVFVNTS